MSVGFLLGQLLLVPSELAPNSSATGPPSPVAMASWPLIHHCPANSLRNQPVLSDTRDGHRAWAVLVPPSAHGPVAECPHLPRTPRDTICPAPCLCGKLCTYGLARPVHGLFSGHAGKPAWVLAPAPAIRTLLWEPLHSCSVSCAPSTVPPFQRQEAGLLLVCG